MRIIGGALKGRRLVAPPGSATRPTSDRAREAVFNILEHAAWMRPLAGVRVIDLFAGAGALGLEALSRGAVFALFVDTSDAARGAVRENLEALGRMGAARVHRRDATDRGQRPAGLGAPFDLAFLDPPYGRGLGPLALAALRDGDWLAPDARLVLETGADERIETPGFDLLDERSYGAARILFLSPH